MRTEVVALAQQLQEAEELADLVVVLQVLPVRAGVSHAQTLRFVGALERVQVEHTAQARHGKTTVKQPGA